jgi:hypothetical protein
MGQVAHPGLVGEPVAPSEAPASDPGPPVCEGASGDDESSSLDEGPPSGGVASMEAPLDEAPSSPDGGVAASDGAAASAAGKAW